MIRKVHIYFHANLSLHLRFARSSDVFRLDWWQFQLGLKANFDSPGPPGRGGRKPDNLETSVGVGGGLTWRLLLTRVRFSVCRPRNGTSRALCWRPRHTSTKTEQAATAPGSRGIRPRLGVTNYSRRSGWPKRPAGGPRSRRRGWPTENGFVQIRDSRTS